jgi:hypothetical protein
MSWRAASSSLVAVLTLLGCTPATGGLGSETGESGGSETGDTDTSSSGNEGNSAEGNEGDGDGDGDPGDGDGDGDPGDGDPGDGDGDPTGGLCGDGIVDAGEDCDADDLAGSDCFSLGFAGGGELTCDDSCQFDTMGCSSITCGNGMLEDGEECDGADFGAANCIDLGEGPGMPTCTNECTIDLSSCGLEGEGEGCLLSNDCKNDLYCEDFNCYDGSLGDPCSFDSQCLGDDCSGFINGHCQ